MKGVDVSPTDALERLRDRRARLKTVVDLFDELNIGREVNVAIQTAEERADAELAQEARGAQEDVERFTERLKFERANASAHGDLRAGVSFAVERECETAGSATAFCWDDSEGAREVDMHRYSSVVAVSQGADLWSGALSVQAPTPIVGNVFLSHRREVAWLDVVRTFEQKAFARANVATLATYGNVARIGTGGTAYTAIGKSPIFGFSGAVKTEGLGGWTFTAARGPQEPASPLMQAKNELRDWLHCSWESLAALLRITRQTLHTAGAVGHRAQPRIAAKIFDARALIAGFLARDEVARLAWIRRDGLRTWEAEGYDAFERCIEKMTRRRNGYGMLEGVSIDDEPMLPLPDRVASVQREREPSEGPR